MNNEIISHKYFNGEVLIRCIDSYKKISDITICDLVLTEDGSYKKVDKVDKIQYTSPLLKIKIFGNNNYINSTENITYLIMHKGYIKANQITTNDYFGIPKNKKSIIPTFRTTLKVNQYSYKEVETYLDDLDYWYLMGYFMGDGWLNHKKKEIYFVINDLQVNEILPKLQKVIGLARLNKSGKNCKKYVGKKQQLFEILSLFGHGAKNKKIPTFIFDAPTNFIKEFISGYKRADGHIRNNLISFTTISQDIAYGLQLLYTKLNIKSTIYYQIRPKTTVIEKRTVNQNNTYSINTYTKNKNFKKPSFIFDENFLWLKVKNIKSVNVDEFVYNISLENNNTYNVYNLITK